MLSARNCTTVKCLRGRGEAQQSNTHLALRVGMVVVGDVLLQAIISSRASLSFETFANNNFCYSGDVARRAWVSSLLSCCGHLETGVGSIRTYGPRGIGERDVLLFTYSCGGRRGAIAANLLSLV